jgi:hypothetical protein
VPLLESSRDRPVQLPFQKKTPALRNTGVEMQPSHHTAVVRANTRPGCGLGDKQKGRIAETNTHGETERTGKRGKGARLDSTPQLSTREETRCKGPVITA